MKQENKQYSYWLILPALILYLAIFILPFFAGLYYSLTNWTIGFDKISFVGLDNFKTIFKNRELVLALKNTFVFAIVVVILKNGLGILLALAVNVKMKTQHFYRVIFYLPGVISTIVIGLIFVPILHPNGFLNDFLRTIGLSFLAKGWLVEKQIVMFTLAAVGVWQWTGYHMAIYLAGLQTISADYYEAAAIEGATPIQKFRYITIPLLIPAININVMLSLIGGLRVFNEVYALTNGGPGYASQVIATEIFAKFGEGRWGLGTALNVVLVVIVAAISIPLLRKMRQQEVDE